MKKILTAIAGIIVVLFFGYALMGCQCQRHGRHTNDYRYVVKICSIGDQEGNSCVEYYAERIAYDTPTLDVYTTDGRHLMYNWAGWSILVTKK